MKRIICLVGVSASGKTTLTKYLKRWMIPKLVSTTTRSKRVGEVEGETYYYVNDKEFDMKIKIEETEYSDNRYCLTKNEVDDKLHNNDFVCVIVDEKGVEQLKKEYGDIVKVVYLYSTPQEITMRMIGRGDSSNNIQKRLRYAVNNGEYKNNYIADHIIRSKDLDLVIKHLKTIIKYEGYPWWKILWGNIKYFFKNII